MIVVLGINAFIATLATSTILSGLTLYVSHGGIITTIPNALTYFGQTRIPFLQIEPPALVGFGLTIVLWYVYEHTPLGRRLYFVGEGREAARLTGLPVNVLRGSTFVGAAVIAGGAGCLLAGELGGMDPSIGPTFLLPAYAAAFLGATTIRPGRFNALGTLVGLYALVVGVTGLELLGVQSWVEQIFDGCVLVVAVAFARAVSADARVRKTTSEEEGSMGNWKHPRTRGILSLGIVAVLVAAVTSVSTAAPARKAAGAPGVAAAKALVASAMKNPGLRWPDHAGRRSGAEGQDGLDRRQLAAESVQHAARQCRDCCAQEGRHQDEADRRERPNNRVDARPGARRVSEARCGYRVGFVDSVPEGSAEGPRLGRCSVRR